MQCNKSFLQFTVQKSLSHKAMIFVRNERNIDSITEQEIRRKHRGLKNVFKGWLFFSFLLQIGLMIFNYWLIITSKHTSFSWTLYLRFPNILRAILGLYILAFIDVSVIKIVGVGKYYKILRHFSYYRTLGLWLLIGFVDLYVLRYPIFLVDLTILIFNESMTFWLILYIVLDVLFLIEFYVSIYVVYYIGVWRNIKENLLVKKEPQAIPFQSTHQGVTQNIQFTTYRTTNKIITL